MDNLIASLVFAMVVVFVVGSFFSFFSLSFCIVIKHCKKDDEFNVSLCPSFMHIAS